MTIAERVVAEARGWLGTPYLHQASLCGAGTDCLGLLRGVWRAIHGKEPEPVPAYTADWAEPDHREVLFEAACRWLVAKHLDEDALGDVLLVCSDGLCGMLPDNQIAHMLRTELDLQRCANKLIDAANEEGGVDNITALVARIDPA